MKFKILLVAIMCSVVLACEQTKKVDSEDSYGVFFENLKDRDTVTSPVVIKMGIKGMEVEPAGNLNPGRGHHHLIVDGSFIEKGKVVTKDETHFHFGKGQTIDTLQLSPGSHTLTLQFADGMHQSYGQDWSYTIDVFVKK